MGYSVIASGNGYTPARRPKEEGTGSNREQIHTNQKGEKEPFPTGFPATSTDLNKRGKEGSPF